MTASAIFPASALATWLVARRGAAGSGWSSLFGYSLFLRPRSSTPSTSSRATGVASEPPRSHLLNPLGLAGVLRFALFLFDQVLNLQARQLAQHLLTTARPALNEFTQIHSLLDAVH